MNNEDKSSNEPITNDQPIHIPMKDRRPLSETIAKYRTYKMSYFSDMIPANLRKTESLDVLQRQHFGKYADYVGETVCVMPFREEFRGVYSTAFSIDGSAVIIGLGNGEIQISDKKKKLTKIVDSSITDDTITCLKFHPTEQDCFYSGNIMGKISLNNLQGETKIEVIEPNNEINTLDVGPLGSMLITAGKDACIRLYDQETMQVINTYESAGPEPTGHTMRLYCVKIHPSECSLFVSGGWDGRVNIWDIRTPSGLIRTIHGPFVNGDSIDIRDRKLLVGSNRDINNLELFDLGSGLLMQNIVPTNRKASLDGDELYTAQFFSGDPSDDLIVCGGAGYGAFKVISLKEVMIVAAFEENAPVITSCCFEDEICFGSKSGNCCIVKYSTGGIEESIDAKSNESEEEDSHVHDISDGDSKIREENENP